MWTLYYSWLNAEMKRAKAAEIKKKFKLFLHKDIAFYANDDITSSIGAIIPLNVALFVFGAYGHDTIS
jgi:hypothetical protein